MGYSVTTDLVDGGDGNLGNRVVSSSAGSTCPPDSTVPACATSTSVLEASITLSGVTSSFTLTGPPNTTVSSEGAVTMTVATNSPGGYLSRSRP